MTINNKKITLIKNSHIDETEMLLNKLLKDADMSQAVFAKKIGKDASTINRWIKNSRAIAWENAEKIAKILGCHPVDIYKPQKEITLKQFCNWEGFVKDIDKENQHLIQVPYEYMSSQLKAIQMEAPGTPLDGSVWLFDLPKFKKFTKYSIGKICYLTASASFKKKTKAATDIDCQPVVGLLTPQGGGKLSIINSYTQEPLNDHCKNLDYNDLEYASPVKAIYDPDMISYTPK